MMVQSLRGVGDTVMGPNGIPVNVDTGDSVTLDFSQGYAAAPGAPGSGTTYTAPNSASGGTILGFNTPIAGQNAPTVSTAGAPMNIMVILAFVVFGLVFVSRK